MIISQTNMFTFQHYSCHVILLLSILISAAAAAEKDQLAEKVCKHASNYTFCRSALYSDPRAPEADEILLAYISFGLAYANATNTHKLITGLIKNSSSSSPAAAPLRKCLGYYDKAVKKIGLGLNDLDSETYYYLGRHAGNASSFAAGCEASFVGRSPLTAVNGFLVGLCEICSVVAKLFHVS